MCYCKLTVTEENGEYTAHFGEAAPSIRPILSIHVAGHGCEEVRQRAVESARAHMAKKHGSPAVKGL